MAEQKTSGRRQTWVSHLIWTVIPGLLFGNATFLILMRKGGPLIGLVFYLALLIFYGVDDDPIAAR